MKVIIAGSRTINEWAVISEAIKGSGWLSEISQLVCGCARGVDRMSKAFIEGYNASIPTRFYPAWPEQAEWADSQTRGGDCVYSMPKTQGRASGAIRNKTMAENADALIAITTGSAGTANMIREAEKRGLKVYVHRVEAK